MPKLPPLVILGLTGLVSLGHAGCGSSPPADSADQASTNGQRSGLDESRPTEPVRLTPVPLPPGVPPQALTPPTGLAARRATLTLPQIIGSLDAPAHLRGSPDDPVAVPDPPSSKIATQADSAPPPLAAQKFYANGRQALLLGDNFGAVQAFNQALRLSPDSPAILRSLGEAWTRAGNRVSAANSYRQALAADPADLTSLIMLGRFALEDRRVDDAILHLHRALQIAEADDTADPAAARLVQFYLANTLNQADYIAAARQMFDRYFTAADQGAPPPSTLARELALIDSQGGETLVLLGDVHHRLGDPEAADQAYRLAQRVGVLNERTLQLRLLYTRLRLGQKTSAQSILTSLIADPAEAGTTRPDADTLELIRYAVDQGLPTDQLVDRLREMYHQQDRPVALVLALADVTPPADAARLLRQHLVARPGDTAVFGRLLDLLLRDADLPDRHRQAIDTTARAMAASPALADRFAQQLLQRVDDLPALLAAFPAPPVDSSAEAGNDALPDSPTPDASAPDAAAAVTESPSAEAAAREVLRGEILLQLDRLEEARQALRRAARLDASQSTARLELAELEIAAQQYAAAETLLDQLPEASARSPRATQLRVRILTATDRREQALALLDETLRREPPGSPLMIDKADLLLADGQVATAERVLLDALNARPTDESIYEKLLAIYESNGSMQQNYQRLRRRMFETIPEAAVTRLVQAQTLVAMRQFREAERVLAQLRQQAAGRPDYQLEAQRLQMEVFASTQQGERVAQLLEQHLAEAGDDPDDALLAFAARYYRQRDDQTRYFEIEELRWRNRPPSLERSAVLAQVYFNQEKFPEALAMSHEAFDLATPEDNRVLQFIGGVWARSILEVGPEAQALDDLKQLREKHPALAGELAQQLALVYQSRAQEPASREILRLGLQWEPRNANLNNALGYSLANAGIDLPEARQRLTVALEIDPDNAAYLDSMGWVLYKLGNFDGARDWLLKSRDADPVAHPVILDHLGDAFYRLGELPEAVSHWRQARNKLAEPDHQMIDPEEQGLPDRLRAKLDAVAQQQPAPVAPLGQGIKPPPDLLQDPPAPQAPAAPGDPPPPPAAAPLPPAPAPAPPPAVPTTPDPAQPTTPAAQ